MDVHQTRQLENRFVQRQVVGILIDYGDFVKIVPKELKQKPGSVVCSHLLIRVISTITV